MIQFKVIINCLECEEFIQKCLCSLRSQTYSHWDAFVTVEPSKDRTYVLALQLSEIDNRIHLRQNSTRRYSLDNQVSAIKWSGNDQEDVIVSLDGDDWLCTDRALQIIAETYTRENCWVTYGSWFSRCPVEGLEDYGWWPAYPEGTEDFREGRWLGTAVRTWKRWTWDLIRDEDLRDSTGEYFMVAEDRAIMLPLLEMCGTQRARHIAELLMEYNFRDVNGSAMTAEAEQNIDLLRHRPAYGRITNHPD